MKWKRIASLALWLCLAPPVGLWKLWQDESLTTSTKWRVLVYLFIMPALLYVAVSVWTTNRALQNLIP